MFADDSVIFRSAPPPRRLVVSPSLTFVSTLVQFVFLSDSFVIMTSNYSTVNKPHFDLFSFKFL